MILKNKKEIIPFYSTVNRNFTLYNGDCIKILPSLKDKYDLVFADPPYFLSNGGLTINNGKVTSVNKAKWDSLKHIKSLDNFNREWLSVVREKMKENATIWISGTYHNIFSVGNILKELNFRILNIITWKKPNPPPNFSKRFFTYSTEQIIWARKNDKIPHYFNYDLMKEMNGCKQMKDVWEINSVTKEEKKFGKHPVQKPLKLLERIILASSQNGDIVLDPFTGSSTTGIAAITNKRRFIGIDTRKSYLNISVRRIENINN